MEFWSNLKNTFTNSATISRAFIETQIRDIGRAFWVARADFPTDQEYFHILKRFGKYLK
jgi:hypothetical protein